jgi:predicted DCC family thiol-disulfide oxidoreductase YuxK
MPSTPLATLIYNGHCPRCAAFARWCLRWGQGRLQALSYDEPGAMDLHPKLSYARALSVPQVILANGYLCQGAEAVAWAIGSRPGFSFITVLYHLPLFRQLGQLLYWIFQARPKPCDACP